MIQLTLHSIWQDNPMATCLFTDAKLDSDTKVEHTIQRALGGRVRSKIVTSSIFNELCGGRIDPYFSGIYAETMRVLGPCLTSEARSASEKFKIIGQDGWWQIDERGRLMLSGNSVQYAEGGTPLSAIGPSMDSLKRIIKKLKLTPVRQSELLPPQKEVIFPERAMLHWRIEVAALKAILLTFDHLLKDDLDRFTRSAALVPVRQFIREVVEADSDGTPTEPLADYTLGLQYDQDYLELYELLRKVSGLPSSPFRHTLIVSANLATRSLDAVFWAFETEPHAFRLSRKWQGGTFTYVMTNGILLGQEASQPILLDQGHLLGRYNNRRNRMRVTIPLTQQDREKAATEIMDRRMTLYQLAVEHVERTNDASVSEQLSRLARLNDNGDHTLTSAVFCHLMTLFAGRLDTEAKADQFMDIVSPILDGAGNDAFPAGATPETVPAQGWPYWLARYRQCLDALRIPFGLPGRIFRAGSRTEMNVALINP